jgi:exonuclease VII small subunit
MKFSITTMTTIALIATGLFGFGFTGITPIKAQNNTVPSNMTGLANMTEPNMTTSDTSGNSAKMHLEEGIKALKNGDNQAAKTHLDAAKQAMTNAPGEAVKHFEEGMKALENGDSKGAIMHLDFADQALG